MAELTFSQTKSPNFLLPGLIAFAVIGGAIGLLAWLTPHRVADISALRVLQLLKQIYCDDLK